MEQRQQQLTTEYLLRTLTEKITSNRIELKIQLHANFELVRKAIDEREKALCEQLEFCLNKMQAEAELYVKQQLEEVIVRANEWKERYIDGQILHSKKIYTKKCTGQMPSSLRNARRTTGSKHRLAANADGLFQSRVCVVRTLHSK